MNLSNRGRAVLPAVLILAILFLGSISSSHAASAFVSITDVSVSPSLIEAANPDASVVVQATIQATAVSVYGIEFVQADIHQAGTFLKSFPLFDDGKHGDRAAKDRVWAESIPSADLGPGDYTIIITARNSRGESDSAAPVPFSIVPPVKTVEKAVLKETAEVLSEADAHRTARAQASQIDTLVAAAQASLGATSSPSTDSRLAVPLIQNGDPATKLDILFVGKGFTQAEFESVVRDVYSKSFGVYSPFDTNLSAINAWVLRSENVYTDVTSAYPENDKYINNDNRVREAQSYNPFVDKVMVLSKDNFRSYAYFDGASFVSYAGAGSNLDAGTVVMHEFGHSFGALLDEYTEVGSYTNDPNCLAFVPPEWERSKGTTYTDHVQSGTATSIVRPYDGCSYTHGKNWRPTYLSIMRNNWGGNTGFGPINERRMLERLQPYTGNPATVLSSPRAGDTWPQGSTQVVRWLPGLGVPARFKILSAASGTSSSSVLDLAIDSASSRGDFPVKIPALAPGKYTAVLLAGDGSTSLATESISIVPALLPNKVLSGLCVAKTAGNQFGLSVAAGTARIVGGSQSFTKSDLSLPPAYELDIYAEVYDGSQGGPVFNYIFSNSKTNSSLENDYTNYESNSVLLARVKTSGQDRSAPGFDPLGSYFPGIVEKIESFVPGCAGYARSGSVFKITKPSAGEELEVGKSYSITWNDPDISTQPAYDAYRLDLLRGTTTVGGIYPYIPSETAHGNSHTWKVGEAPFSSSESTYLAGLAPLGTYTVRLSKKDGTGVATSSAFKIVGLPASIFVPASYASIGETLTVSWEVRKPGASDWIGIVPRGAQWANGMPWFRTGPSAKGSTNVVLPTTPGEYDFVLYQGPPRTEVARTPILVTKPYMYMGPSSYYVYARQSTEINWYTDAARPYAKDWITIVPKGTQWKSGMSYFYTDGKTSGAKKITAPATGGLYELVYYQNNGFLEVGRSSPFYVYPKFVSLSTYPYQVYPGDIVSATWSVLGGPLPRDWVGLAPSGGTWRDGFPWFNTDGKATGTKSFVVTMPPGVYDMVYFEPGPKPLDYRSAIEVRPGATVEFPYGGKYKPGASAIVAWIARSEAASPRDWIGIVPRGTQWSNGMPWFSVGSLKGTRTISTPRTSGVYEAVYYRSIRAGLWSETGRSNPITVTP